MRWGCPGHRGMWVHTQELFPAALNGPLPPGRWNIQVKGGKKHRDPMAGLAPAPPNQPSNFKFPCCNCGFRPFVGLRTMCLSPRQGLQAGYSPGLTSQSPWSVTNGSEGKAHGSQPGLPLQTHPPPGRGRGHGAGVSGHCPFNQHPLYPMPHTAFRPSWISLRGLVGSPGLGGQEAQV